MSDGKFSKSELKVQAIARRRAAEQLMRVPWSRFQKAYEEYPRWQALALWIQAVIAAQDSVPSWLIDDLLKRCPGFIEHEANSKEPKLMGLHLLEWAHNHEFASAKQEGWLDALTFYGVRHPRSECAWAYWESCETQWGNDRPDIFPAFDQWWKEAQDMIVCDKISYCALGESVEKYLDWEALVLWLRPLFSSNAKLPMHVMSELRRKFPGILAKQNSERSPRDQENSKIWRRLIKWGNDHYLKEAKEADSLDLLLQRVRSHPLHVRLVHYGKHWAKEWSGSCARPYPSFQEWLHDAQMRFSPKRMSKATLTSRTITLHDLLGQPGLSRAACDVLVKLQPTTILKALRIRGVGRKTTSRLFALGLLTDPEGLQNRALTLADLRGK